MISTTTAYKQQLIAGNRNYQIKVEMTLADNTEITLTNEDIWDNGISFDSAISSENSFDIGAAIIGSLKVVINNITGIYNSYDFYGARIVLWMGVSGDLNAYDQQVYYRIGFYTVDEPQYNGSLITLNCLDNMTYFDVPFSDITGITYPITAGTLVSRICSQLGVTLATSNFPNYNTSITVPPEDNVNCREVIQWVAQMCCCYCKINTAGQLKLGWYDKSLIVNMIDYDGGTFSTTTTPYSDGVELNGGDFSYSGSGAEAITVTFDANCETESGYDKLDVYYEDNGVYYKRSFSGSFGGESFYIPTTKFWLTFTSDYSIVKWGWRISSILPAQSGEVMGFSVSSLPSVSWTRVTDTSNMPESPHPYESYTSTAYYFDLDFVEDDVDGGLFTDFNNSAYIASNYDMQVSTDNIVITGCRVVNNTSEEDAYNVLYADSTLEQTHERYILVIENNPFITSDNANAIATTVGTTLAGLIVRPFNSNSLSDLSYETGDMVTVVDFRGNRYYTWLTNLTFTTNNSEQFSCGAQSIKKRSETRYSQTLQTLAEARENASKQLTDYDNAVKAMNELAQSAIGYNRYEYTVGAGIVTWLYNGAQISTTDPANPTFPNSTVVFKISGDGVFISHDGGTTYTDGYDANSGTAILSLIYAIGLSADWINTGSISIGGSTRNIDGKIDVYDASGNLIGQWDKNGFETVSQYVKSGTTYQRGVRITDGKMEFIPPVASPSTDASIQFRSGVTSGATAGIDIIADGNVFLRANDSQSVNGGYGEIDVSDSSVYIRSHDSDYDDKAEIELTEDGDATISCTDRLTLDFRNLTVNDYSLYNGNVVSAIEYSTLSNVTTDLSIDFNNGYASWNVLTIDVATGDYSKTSRKGFVCN